jgi:F-type H+-transporting ATPase subunit b
MFVATAFAQTDDGEPAVNGAGAASSGDLHTETGVPADAAHHQGVFPPFDSSTYASQVFWLALTFGLFYLFLKRVVLPRMAGILETRRDRIAQDLDQAARLKQQADEAIAAYEQEVAEGRANAARIGQEARDKAKADADAERRKIEAELEKKLGEAEARIAGIKSSAMAEVGSIAEDTAAAVVESLLGVKVSKADAAKAVKAVHG